MRPSNKSRSRNKNANRRSVGNVINRVFDSSGPEGKVRGTPQQIIEKYLALSRDASLSGDRVGEENFAQHAEHYVRLLNEANREMQERREQEGQGGPRRDDEGRPHEGEGQHRPRQEYRDERFDEPRSGSGNDRQDRDDRDERDERDERRDRSERGDREDQRRTQERAERAPRHVTPEAAPELPEAPAAGLETLAPDADTATEAGLVETPEDRPAPKRRGRPPRKKPVVEGGENDTRAAE